MAIGSNIDEQPENYDRTKEVKEFDESKIGCKGLVDSGITTIPKFFVHPPESLPTPTTNSNSDSNSNSIPVIDLADPRPTVVDQIHRAAGTWGFFQILNHGIPTEFLHRLMSSIKSFNEQPTSLKAKHYNREKDSGVAFNTNFDLLEAKAATWRDTIQIKLGPKPVGFDRVPEICRGEVIEWNQHIDRLGESLMGILAEGLGLETNRMKDLTFSETKLMVGHYYPYCPEPDRTVGIQSHMDPSVFTLLVQDMIGGLQVKHGEDWVDVKPVDGALVVNIGDFLQVIRELRGHFRLKSDKKGKNGIFVNYCQKACRDRHFRHLQLPDTRAQHSGHSDAIPSLAALPGLLHANRAFFRRFWALG